MVHALADRLLIGLRELPPTSLARLPIPLATPDLFPSAPSSPIVPLLTDAPLDLAGHLQRAGFLVRALRYPTVPRDEERVRICLHAANTAAEVDRLVDVVRAWVADVGASGSALRAKL